jgi:hypothetical protein
MVPDMCQFTQTIGTDAGRRAAGRCSASGSALDAKQSGSNPLSIRCLRRFSTDKRPIEKRDCVGIVPAGIIFRYDAKRGAAMMMEKAALTFQDVPSQSSQEPTSLAI